MHETLLFSPGSHVAEKASTITVCDSEPSCKSAINSVTTSSFFISGASVSTMEPTLSNEVTGADRIASIARDHDARDSSRLLAVSATAAYPPAMARSRERGRAAAHRRHRFPGAAHHDASASPDLTNGGW